MEEVSEFEKAVYEVHSAICALEKIALNNDIDAGKVVEFLLSFKFKLDIVSKTKLAMQLNGQANYHAIIVLENQVNFEIPIWEAYKGKIERITEIQHLNSYLTEN